MVPRDPPHPSFPANFPQIFAESHRASPLTPTPEGTEAQKQVTSEGPPLLGDWSQDFELAVQPSPWTFLLGILRSFCGR